MSKTYLKDVAARTAKLFAANEDPAGAFLDAAKTGKRGAWQVRVDGNLDNVDSDYQGKYAWSTCYNSEEGANLAEMMSKEQDWVVIFNIKRIEDGVKRGDFTEINGVPVLDGRQLRGRDGLRYPGRELDGFRRLRSTLCGILSDSYDRPVLPALSGHLASRVA